MPIDYEAEYNNRARVPEHPEIMAGWAQAAAQAREALPGPRDLSYGERPRNLIDGFVPPKREETAAVVMFIHGGYWQFLDKSSFSHLARGLFEHGIATYVPSYTLCPQARVGDIIEEMRRAVETVYRRAGRRVVVAGHSAGGHLAGALLATDWSARAGDLPAGLVPAAYSISGLFDLAPLIETSINKALGLDAAEARAASPVHWPAPKGLVLDAVVGGAESAEFHRQSAELAQVWGRAGVATRYESAPNANHFDVIAPMADPESAMTARLVSLARSSGPK